MDTATGLYSLRARYYNPALGRFLSGDTYPYNFNNPVELNRYAYTANSPINLADPTGNFALTEYAINLAKTGAIGGALSGVAATVFCGGNLIGNVLFGALAGAGAGLAFAYSPLVTQGAGIILGGIGAGSSIHDGVVNGWNKCNTFTAVTSLLAVALSGWSLVNDSLSGLGEISYYDEMLNPSMGHNGYYTGEYSKIPGFSWEESVWIQTRLKSPTMEFERFCHFASTCGVAQSPLYPSEIETINPNFKWMGDLKSNLTANDLQPGDLLVYYGYRSDNPDLVVLHSDRIFSIDGNEIIVFDKPGQNIEYSLYELWQIMEWSDWKSILVYRK